VYVCWSCMNIPIRVLCVVGGWVGGWVFCILFYFLIQ
jgi:hypothetical protein